LPPPQAGNFETWIEELRALAAEHDLGWAIATHSATLRLAYDEGHSAAEEFMAIKDMAEWRGCGCAGG
jgi:hypothetical protein